VRGHFQAAENLFQHRLDIIQDFVIPKPQDAVAQSFQMLGSGRVLFFLIGMLPAVGFYDELRLETGEVNDVRFDRQLASELEASQSAISQATPQQSFGVRCAAA